MERATSTAPPPATSELDSRTRLTTQRESWSERSISSRKNSLAPRTMMVWADCSAMPSKNMYSQSPIFLSSTLAQVPRFSASKVSLPSSMSAREITTLAPVDLAMRLRSNFLTRLTAITPASTKYLRAKSSMPREQSTTLAPASMIFWQRVLQMSISFWRILSSSSASLVRTWTPIWRRNLLRLKSTQATLQFSSNLGMPWEPREASMA
mmetsp:Transcript_33773/g.41732  ORF Transcript_33773/g.41732 Transcript_33773/m.41732 type:complete len:209 (+) Transcript_33773:515-1141(+)